MSLESVGTSTSTALDFASVLTPPRSVLTLLSPFVPPRHVAMNGNKFNDLSGSFQEQNALDVGEGIHVQHSDV